MTSTSYDLEFEVADDVSTAKRVGDINAVGLERNVDDRVEKVEGVFGACELDKRPCAHAKNDNGDVAMDQDEYNKQLRPISFPDFAGADPNVKAAKK